MCKVLNIKPRLHVYISIQILIIHCAYFSNFWHWSSFVKIEKAWYPAWQKNDRFYSYFSFPHLGIQCAKKKDVEGNLKQRKEINVDPFQSKEVLAYTKYKLFKFFV